MGQPQSTDGRTPRTAEGKRRSQGSETRDEEESVPYTRYSRPIPDPKSSASPGTLKGITVVNPNPTTDLRYFKPMELQKLERVTRFLPIIKSSAEEVQAHERVTDGLNYRLLLDMCTRYQHHLTECSTIVSTEQKALASRLRDLEMFSAGVAQQMVRRQDKLSRALTHLQRVNEVSATLERMTTALEHCIPLVHRLNNLLPEEQRLEQFRLRNPVRRDSAIATVATAVAKKNEKEEEEEEMKTRPQPDAAVMTLPRQ